MKVEKYSKFILKWEKFEEDGIGGGEENSVEVVGVRGGGV